MDVYADGAINCWGFVDLPLFRGKLARGWVVPRAEVGGTLSIHDLGQARVAAARWNLTTADIDIRDDYIGEGYGVVTPGSREALALLARTEGILLDPVYTGKAMAGLIDDARHGRLGAGDQVVFVHTGGTPAVFAYRDELTE